MMNYQWKNVISLVIFILPIAVHAFYCSPICGGADSGLCTSASASSCTGPTCDTSYSWNITTLNCQLPSTTTVLTNQLSANTNFAISGWTSSKTLANINCGGANGGYMMGPYVRNDFASKTYTGLGTSHYSIELLYSFGLMGNNWLNNSITTIVTDGNGNQVIGSVQGQTCGAIQAMSPCSNNLGCFKNYHLTIGHTTDLLSLQFTASGSSIDTNVAIQSWGLANLIVLLNICDPLCLTCFGPTNTSCTSCAAGLSLQGSVCILVCPYFTIPSSGLCVMSCPAYYFVNTANNYCESCPNGCSACTIANTCQSWDSGASPSNLFYDYIALWIILMVLGIVILGIVIWKCFLSKKSFHNILEEDVINQKTVTREQNITHINASTEQMQAHWIEDIDDLHMSKVKVKSKSNDFIQGIGNNLTSTI